jgi:hypothetical protein
VTKAGSVDVDRLTGFVDDPNAGALGDFSDLRS